MDNSSQRLPDSVMIFGCGYVGSALAEKLIANGVRVGALTRNEETAEVLRKKGLSEVVIEEVDSDRWHKVLGDYSAAVNCVSSAGGGLAGYRKSYFEGQRSILNWAATTNLSHYIYTSSTSVYPQDGGLLVDENADTTDAPETGQVLLESEKLIEAAAVSFKNWFVLRLAGIYGPGRHFLLDQLNEGRGVIPGRGDYTLNLIHLYDIVAVIMAALSSNLASRSGIYNVADDSPSLKQEILAWLAAQVGMSVPQFDPDVISSRLKRRGGRMPDRRVDNSKVKAALNWQPRFKSYREGYEELLANHR
ncbi:MAG: NAD-dependent epimerase/dehydratase family protein [Verrucomicrobiota bacterium]